MDIAAEAIKNPIFQQSVGNATFKKLSQTDEETEKQYAHGSGDTNSVGVDQDELDEMEKRARHLRYGYLGVSTFSAITAFMYLTSPSIFIMAFYMLLFSCLICCYEIALKMVAKIIVQNFGFLYNTQGKIVFILFVSFISLNFGIMGYLTFAGFIIILGYDIYISVKHPNFTKFMKKKHFYGSVSK